VYPSVAARKALLAAIGASDDVADLVQVAAWPVPSARVLPENHTKARQHSHGFSFSLFFATMAGR
jgi:hypothetical protein